MQEENEGINSYTKRFKNIADLVEAQSGGIPIMLRNYANAHKEKLGDTYKRLLAFIYAENSSRKKSAELLKALDNDYAAAPKGKGDERFPKDIYEAVSRVVTYKPIVVTQGTMEENQSEKKVALVQPGKNNKKREIECFRCGKNGHIARNCREDLPSQDETYEEKAVDDEKKQKKKATETKFAQFE